MPEMKNKQKKDDTTSVSVAGKKAPSLPHEADESTHSTAEKPDPKVAQGYADVKRGLVDTDKGPVMGRTYERVKAMPKQGRSS